MHTSAPQPGVGNPWTPAPPTLGHRRRPHGVALLEVILALSLFVSAAAVIFSSLSTSLHTAQDLRLAAQANDLAVTLFSQMQLGQVPIADQDAKPFDDPLGDWTYQLITTQIQNPNISVTLTQVEVVIVHQPSAYTFRLVQIMPPVGTGTTTAPANGTGTSQTPQSPAPAAPFSPAFGGSQ